jgi:hypothetical protein
MLVFVPAMFTEYLMVKKTGVQWIVAYPNREYDDVSLYFVVKVMILRKW